MKNSTKIHSNRLIIMLFGFIPLLLFFLLKILTNQNKSDLPKNSTSYHRGTGLSMLTAALVSIAREWHLLFMSKCIENKNEVYTHSGITLSSKEKIKYIGK